MRKIISCVLIALMVIFAGAPLDAAFCRDVYAAPAKGKPAKEKPSEGNKAEEQENDGKEKPIDLGQAWYMYKSSVVAITNTNELKVFSLVMRKGRHYYNRYTFRKKSDMKKKEFDYYNQNDHSWRHYDWGEKTPLYKAYTIGYAVAFENRE